LSQGHSQTQTARIFEVSRQTIHAWKTQHKKGGSQALCSKRRGRPPGGGWLTPAQERTLARLIRDQCPDQLKLPFYLWTREAVVELIKKRFKVRVSVWTAGRFLARWGFTAQKPVRQAFEQDAQAVKSWLRSRYPAIAALARREKATIFWGDEMGLRSDHAAGRSFSPRGHTPVILGTGQRFGCNVISAITNRGHLQFMVFKSPFTVPVFLKFLRQLLRQNQGRKIFLIIDGHPVHRSRRVARWIKEHQEVLRVYFLPAYSPQLNPDEYLNQDVKTNAVGRTRAATRPEMMGHIRAYLRSTGSHRPLVKRYFHAKQVRYALP